MEEDKVILAVLRPEIDPPIATSAVQLFLFKSFREQRSAFPCVRSCGKVNCDHNVLVYDGIIVEEDATPVGLNMVSRDVLGIIPRYNSHNSKEIDEIVETFGGLGLLQTIISRTKRDAKDERHVGLNYVMGLKEGGMPLLIDQELNNLHGGVQVPAEAEEGATALPPPERSPGPTVYLGPMRNATPDNIIYSLPILQLQGVSNCNSVGQLIDAWCHYTSKLSEYVERPEYLMYNNKRCNRKVLIKDLGMLMEGLYFTLPVSTILIAQEDDRDIDQLLGFIEGEDGKEKEDKSERKKRRKKKKKIASEQPASGERSKVRHEQRISTEEAALGIAASKIEHSRLNPTKPDDQGTGKTVEKEAKEQNTAGEKSKVRHDQKTSTEETEDTLTGIKSSLKPTKLGNRRAEMEGKETVEKSKVLFKLQTSTEETALSQATMTADTQSSLKPTKLGKQRAQINRNKTIKMSKDLLKQQTLSRDEGLTSTESSLKPTKLGDRKAELVEKEILLQQRREFLEDIVEVSGKEMATLITDIEAAEDEKVGKVKEKSEVTTKISDLQTKHESLVREIQKKDEAMIKLVQKKRDLESYIENSVLETKKEIALLEEEMKSLKTRLTPQSPKDEGKGKSQLNLQLLEFINSKIEAKEQELECPVCLEVAAPPIFTCTDLHIICSDCRPKVTSCQTTSSTE